jgi:methylphosphotriester-DNA--protein-cysteine methyltransferase
MSSTAPVRETITSMSFDERYRVIQSRDPRFDGQFLTAVRSTGIYNRPNCPARTPKESNVTFYATSEAGYRACKRCPPEGGTRIAGIEPARRHDGARAPERRHADRWVSEADGRRSRS